MGDLGTGSFLSLLDGLLIRQKGDGETGLSIAPEPALMKSVRIEHGSCRFT